LGLRQQPPFWVAVALVLDVRADRGHLELGLAVALRAVGAASGDVQATRARRAALLHRLVPGAEVQDSVDVDEPGNAALVGIGLARAVGGAVTPEHTR